MTISDDYTIELPADVEQFRQALSRAAAYLNPIMEEWSRSMVRLGSLLAEALETDEASGMTLDELLAGREEDG